VRGVKTSRNVQTREAETARARKRAEFLSTIRQASQTALATTRDARPTRPTRADDHAARPTIVEVAVKPAPRRESPRPVAGGRGPAPAAVARPATAPPAAAKPQAAQPPAAPRLFREEALRNRLAYEEGRGLVRVSPPWTWALLWVVVTALALALAASFVGEVDVTGRGRGILRPAAGVRVLTSQLGGTVTRVEVRPGQRVKPGTAILRIESPAVQAQLLEADRELEALRTQFTGVSAQQDQHYREQVENLRARVRRGVDQITSLRSSVAHAERRVEADGGLLKKGLVSDMAVSDSRDALAQAQRQLSAAEQALDQTRQELGSLEGQRQDALWNRQQLIAAAQNKRDALAVVLRQGVLEAPEDGTVDALVRAGEVVQPGQVVGKLVPVDSRLQVVSFLAERDRAFAKPGDAVELELDQLPHAQYGTVRGRITRIGDDLASAAELREAFGDDAKVPPSYRVEIEITDASAAVNAHVKLRTGGLMDVRFTLRRQRLVTLVLKPLERWFR
jgi:multidrug resistance efflux pump